MECSEAFGRLNFEQTSYTDPIAERFWKRHDKLISEIERMYGDLEYLGSPQNGGHPMFTKTYYIHPQNNQKYPKYIMNRDGFSLLAMGFTGKKALAWKLKKNSSPQNWGQSFHLMQ